MALDFQKLKNIQTEYQSGVQPPTNQGFSVTSKPTQKVSPMKQSEEKGPGLIEKVAEFGTGAVTQVPSFAGNLVGSAVKLTKYINPSDLATRFGVDTPEIFRSEFLGEKIQQAGKEVRERALMGHEALGGERGGALKAGQAATDLGLTIVGTMMAPKPSQLTKLPGRAGYLIGKMRNFASSMPTKGVSGFLSKQAARIPGTLSESAAATSLYTAGARGRLPSAQDIETGAKIDLGMQLGLGLIGAIAKPAAKGVAKLVTGVGEEAFEGIKKPEVAKRAKQALSGDYNISETRKAAKEAYKQIQPEANRVYKEALEKYIPDAKNIKVSKQYKVNLLKSIQDGLKDRMETLTAAQSKEIDRLTKIITEWTDDSIDGWKNLSIRMGNEINEAVATQKVGNQFMAAKYIVDGGINDVLNEVTNQGWSRVNALYAPYKELQGNLQPLLSPKARTVEGFLRAAEKESVDRVALKEYFKQLDEIAGTNISNDLTAILAAKEFEQGRGVIGSWVAGFGLGKPLGNILTTMIPALDKVSFSNYMAVPMGITRGQFIPLDPKKDPIEKRIGIQNVAIGGDRDFGFSQ